MRYSFYIIIFLLCVSAISGYAHDVNKAFFQITGKDGFTEVRAEFPWTLRAALVDFNPDLNNSSTTKVDFESTFLRYLDANLRLIDNKSNQLTVLDFTEIKEEGSHSHQSTYMITYGGTAIAEISNTVMFNIYDNQVNYNEAVVGEHTYSFKTTYGNEGVPLESVKDQSSWWLYIIVSIVLGCLFLLGWKSYKPKNDDDADSIPAIS